MEEQLRDLLEISQRMIAKPTKFYSDSEWILVIDKKDWEAFKRLSRTLKKMVKEERG